VVPIQGAYPERKEEKGTEMLGVGKIQMLSLGPAWLRRQEDPASRSEKVKEDHDRKNIAISSRTRKFRLRGFRNKPGRIPAGKTQGQSEGNRGSQGRSGPLKNH